MLNGAMPDAMLEVRGLNAWYGESHILHGVDFDVREGEVVTLLGRNGAGKTTTMKSIMGLVPRREGQIAFKGQETVNLRSDMIARAGIALCPEERGIFASLSVTENLTATARSGPWTLARIYALFPRLAERRRNMGNQLSGGEQQMLAIGRALMRNPTLLLLDEPTEGLAPVIAAEVMAAITTIVAQGMSALIVEQHAQKILALTDRAIILQRGMVAWRGESQALLADPAALERLLGVGENQGA